MNYWLFDEEKLAMVDARAEFQEPAHDFSKVQAVKSGKGIDDMTDEEKFLEGKKGIGGSSVADILGCGFNGLSGPVQLYIKKKLDEPEPIDPKTRRLFDQGHFSEEVIFEMIQNLLPPGWQCLKDKDRYTDVERNYMFADYDCILVAPWGEEFVGEIKSFKDFPGRPKLKSGVYGEGAVMAHDFYHWQVRYYLRERNCRAGVVFSLPMAEFDEAQLKTCVIYRDFDKENEMVKRIDDFWKHVEKNEIPEFDSLSDEAYKSLINLIEVPYTEGKTGKFPKAALDFLKSREEIVAEIENEKAKKKEIEKAIKEKQEKINALNAYLVQVMGDNQQCSISNKEKEYTAYRNISTRETVKIKELKKEYPEIAQKYINTSMSKSLEVVSYERED